ncbi:MAG: hypothetical protein WAM60_00885 [Candidatus Promineifilaceae bacterium]
MRQTSTTAILLTFVTTLLILVAAVVFLARDKEVLEQQTGELESEQTVLTAARDQLNNDLAVRESALDTAEATRDTMATEIAGQLDAIEALSTQVAQQEAIASEAEAAANQPKIQLFLFASNNGAEVLPTDNIELFVAAYADDGIDNIQVTLDGDPWQSYQGGGDLSTILRFTWTPEVEDTFTIQATGEDVNGRQSEPVALTITALYPNEEARQEALRQQVGASIISLRMPETADGQTTNGPTPQQPVTGTTPTTLHEQLLFGSDDYSEGEAQLDELVYRAFRLIPDDFDLAAYADSLNEQNVLGAYNPDTLAVVAYSPVLGEEADYNRWLTAHDTMHDLQSQSFGLGQINILALPTDGRLALRAIAEGEANFVQYSYLQDSKFFTPKEQVSVTDTLNQEALSLFNDAPPFLRAQFEFAYRSGFQFIQFLFEQGGYELVNTVWSSRPQSSEQILHPESYLSGDIPTAVSVPSLTGVLGEGWQLIRKDTLGEFYLQQHLSGELSPEEIAPAVTGWGGDQYEVYWNAADDELVMALLLTWDEPSDAAEFITAYTNYLRRLYTEESQLQQDGGQCWQGEDVTCFYQLDVQTFIVRAPDLETAADIATVQIQAIVQNS